MNVFIIKATKLDLFVFKQLLLGISEDVSNFDAFWTLVMPVLRNLRCIESTKASHTALLWNM